jgi:hypothetical protein
LRNRTKEILITAIVGISFALLAFVLRALARMTTGHTRIKAYTRIEARTRVEARTRINARIRFEARTRIDARTRAIIIIRA